MSGARNRHRLEVKSLDYEKLDGIARELHEIIRQKGVTVAEAKSIYAIAQNRAFSNPNILALYKKWEDALIE